MATNQHRIKLESQQGLYVSDINGQRVHLCITSVHGHMGATLSAEEAEELIDALHEVMRMQLIDAQMDAADHLRDSIRHEVVA